MQAIKRYKRVALAYILLSFLFIFVVINLNNGSNIEFGSSAFLNKNTLLRQLEEKNRMWPHQFVKNLTCEPFIDGTATKKDIFEENRRWNYSDEFFFERVSAMGDDCSAIQQIFDFNTKPLSDEELNYPLAYGMIIYKNLAQVYFTMSAIYQPQNSYCIAMDGKVSDKFKVSILKLAKCFPNITIIQEKSIKWCRKEILESLFDCFQHLTFSSHPWKYYQYFSGFDLPLKTNLEMVRIFKQLNGTVIGEATLGGRIRLTTRINNETFLPIQKSSMGALISREAANDALRNSINRKIVEEAIKHVFNKSGSVYRCCSDELLWSTVFGNKKVFPISGSYDAKSILKQKVIRAYSSMLLNQNIIAKTPADPYPLEHYNMARRQIWFGKKSVCKGKYKAASCVYGLGDLHSLIGRAELSAHKFHMEFQPQTYFCLWKHVKDRQFDPNHQFFEGRNYKKLPHVRLNNGIQPEHLYNEYVNSS